MNNEFMNRKDKIISAAIQLIDESGLSSLTFQNLAIKFNMPKEMLYRYYGSTDEILEEIVDVFTNQDAIIFAKVEAMDIPHVKKVNEFFKLAYNTYQRHGNFLILPMNFEELIHNVHTRDILVHSIKARINFIKKEFEAAMNDKEITDVLLTPEELTDIYYGVLWEKILNHRIWEKDVDFTMEKNTVFEKIIDVLKIAQSNPE